MNEYEDDIRLDLQQKAQYFFQNAILIHISLKDGSWLRGYIQDLSPDFFMLSEMKLGLMPVFFVGIKRLEAYRNG